MHRTGQPGDIAALLSRAYGLKPETMTRLNAGQVTVNYKAACGGRDVFVKSYPPGTDLDAEREAIALTALARRAGVPAAEVIPAAGGQVIAVRGTTAVSAWQWMPGATVAGTPSAGQLEHAGHALGLTHSAFAGLPASSGPSPAAARWRDPDLPGLHADISGLLAVIRGRKASGQADAFDARAETALAERAADAARIPGLLASLPALATQVIHGDYSLVNLLYDGSRLTAVLDFRPPEPFLTSYDLGRVAFSPAIVAGGPGWLPSARTLVSAYISANPDVPAADIRACARVALLQLLGSLYGVRQHYRGGGLRQDDLDSFWVLRHAAAGILLSRLPDADAALEDLAASLPGGRRKTRQARSRG